MFPGANDEIVLEYARTDERVVLTNDDKDFKQSRITTA